MKDGPSPADTPDTSMSPRSLLTSVLSVNGGLVAVTAFIAAVVARARLDETAGREGLLLIALAVAGAFLVNSILLRHLLAPLDRLATAMDRVDLHRPRSVRARVRRTD